MRKLMNKKLNKKGFTLMEMLIVVAIIAILIAIAIPTFTSALNKAHDAADAANLRSYYAELQVEKLLNETTTTAPDKTDGSKEYQTVTINGTTYNLYSKYTCTLTAGGDYQFTLKGKTGDIVIPGNSLEGKGNSAARP